MNTLEDNIDEIFSYVGDNGYHENRGARVDCASCKRVEQAKIKVRTLISQLENEVRIDELHNLAKKQKTFVGYGYDDIGVDINDIDDRIATLQAKEQE